MDLGVLLESPRAVSPRIVSGHARALYSRAVAAGSRFPSGGSRDLVFPTRLCHEAFPRSFPTGLSHLPPCCESILGLKVEAVQGKQVSLEWTETSAGLWEWWHDNGVPLAFLWKAPPLRCDGNAGNSFPTTQGKDPSSRARRRKCGSHGYG